MIVGEGHGSRFAPAASLAATVSPPCPCTVHGDLESSQSSDKCTGLRNFHRLHTVTNGTKHPASAFMVNAVNDSLYSPLFLTTPFILLPQPIALKN